MKAEARRQRAELHAALAADVLAFDDSPEGERLRRYELANGRALARSLELLQKHRRAATQIDRSVKTGTFAEFDIHQQTLGIDARKPRRTNPPMPLENATNEPTGFEETTTNEPTDACENVTNEPTDACENATNEPTADPENTTNKPTADCEYVTSEPTGKYEKPPIEPAAPEKNATNEPTPAATSGGSQASEGYICAGMSEVFRREGEAPPEPADAKRLSRSFALPERARDAKRLSRSFALPERTRDAKRLSRSFAYPKCAGAGKRLRRSLALPRMD